MREMTETQLIKEIDKYKPFAINRAKEIIKNTTGREPQDIDEINAITENLIDGHATKIKNLYKIKKGE